MSARAPRAGRGEMRQDFAQPANGERGLAPMAARAETQHKPTAESLQLHTSVRSRRQREGQGTTPTCGFVPWTLRASGSVVLAMALACG